MNAFRLHRDGRAIESVEAWFRLAPPAGGARHWKAGRSALELARAWCPAGQPPAPPVELLALLAGRPEFAGLSLTEARPEQRIAFDDLPGEPRNADLALLGRDAAGPVALTVEAKADETFGDTVESTLRAVARRVARGERSNGAARVQGLVAALLPAGEDDEIPTGALRYQLLTGVAGTLAWAAQQRAARAIFVVHELIRLADTDERHRIRNRHDLDLFLRRLTGGAVRQLARGELVGPFRVPGNAHLRGDIDLYLGKIRRELD